jgi:ubiquitin carboxyl-terminal hydrolase 8
MPSFVSSRPCSSVKSESLAPFRVYPGVNGAVRIIHSVNGVTIEDSLTVAPRDEWVLFRNRDKFDIIAIYDEASETPGPQDAPIASLIRAIYENAFRKILKRVPVLLIGGLEAWKHEFGGQELEGQEEPADPVPMSIPLAQPATEVYMPPPPPQPPAPQHSHVSRTSPPAIPLSSPKPDQSFRALPPVPRSPLPNRMKAGTESVPEARVPPASDSNPRRSVDQGPISPRYGFPRALLHAGLTDRVHLLSHPESGDIPSEPVRRLQRKPTMTRPPSVSSLNSFPRTVSEGVGFLFPLASSLLTSRAALVPFNTANDAQRPHTIPPDRTRAGSAQHRFFLQRFCW